ncbi:MAG TPA: acylneuraminate cytidylyltransferase family protein [Anaerolineales bacterium]|nr:acylneuraminate cytidylyltransferase family protein [Anaerolineales bacterium]
MTPPRVVALVPMRAHSERVPGKNYRDLAGRPLFHHILLALQGCPEITDIVVDTDSETIKKGIAEYFPNVLVLDRPSELRGDEIPMNAILMHDTEMIPADFYIQTHSTNPLLRSQTISVALAAFFIAYPDKDSLFGVTELHTRLYDAKGRALNHNPRELLRTQDLPAVYEENSCLYIFTRTNLEKYDHRIGSSPLMFPVPRDEALDIDEEFDFRVADFLMRQRGPA